MSAPSLSLYRYASCPFCMMVERVIRELHLDVEVRDILMDDQALRELVDATGRRTVPVLKIGEGDQARWMPESRDIMHWLREQFG